MIKHPSPNFGPRPGGTKPSLIVLHYTGMPTADAALARLCDPAYAVSAHYLIDEAGTVVELVSPEARAWHAGVGSWRGHQNVNDISLGIELVNPGHEFGYRPFTHKQMAALTPLLKDLVARFEIDPKAIVGHSDVAPARKSDPGEKFDWRHLAAEGLGLVTRTNTSGRDVLAIPGLSSGAVGLAQQRLTQIGYDVTVNGRLDAETLYALTAFQRHWRQQAVTGLLDTGTVTALDDIARQFGS